MVGFWTLRLHDNCVISHLRGRAEPFKRHTVRRIQTHHVRRRHGAVTPMLRNRVVAHELNDDIVRTAEDSIIFQPAHHHRDLSRIKLGAVRENRAVQSDRLARLSSSSQQRRAEMRLTVHWCSFGFSLGMRSPELASGLVA